MKKRIISIILSIVMLVSLLPTTALAGATTDEPVKTWEIGAPESGTTTATDAVVAKLYTNAADNTKYDLVISGTGEMESTHGTSMPWTYDSTYQKHIVSVTVESGVTNVESYAFKDCTALTSVTIGDTVTEIGSFAFNGCTALTSVTLGATVTEIWGYAFGGCTSLTAYTVDSENTAYSATDDGILFSKDGKTLVSYPSNKSGTSYTVPDSVTKISSSAFCYVTNLRELTIPHTATTIVGTIFYGKAFEETITIKGHTGSAAEDYTEWDSENTTFVSICSDGDDADTLCDVCGYDTAHTAHPVCGATHNNIGDHTGSCEDITWTAWDGISEIIYENNTAYVYLSADAQRGGVLTVASGNTLNLCLNCHTLDLNSNYIKVEVAATLNLCDCASSEGKITGGAGFTQNNVTYGGGVYNLGTFNMYGGAISNNTAQYGGGVYNGDFLTPATFNMYGGTISDNSGSGVYNYTGSTFAMSGGVISGNTSSYGGGLYTSGTATMSGGTIENNTATTKGGGVSNAGTFEMTGGKIVNNTATGTDQNSNGYGGGIYTYGTNVTLSGGAEISGNSAAYYGGGVYNYNGTVTIDGAVIKNNTSGNSGGGVHSAGISTTMISGTITGNTATSGDGGGVYANSKFIMQGGEISSNTAGQYGGGVVSNSTYTQISGGTITGNSAKYGGGFRGMGTISGGTITNNTASSCGGGLHAATGLTLSGNPVISGNTTNSVADNVYLGKNIYSNAQITVTVGTMSSGASIGVTMSGGTGVFSSGGASYVSYFSSDNSAYIVDVDGNNLKLAEPPAETHSHYNCGAAGCTADHGHSSVDSWTAWDGTGTPSGSVYLTGDFTLTETLTISSGAVNLCLNGHSITSSLSATIQVNSGATLNICDCSTGETGGKIANTNTGSYGYGIENSGTVNVYGGSVSGNTYSIYNNGSGAVTVSGGTVSGGSYGIYSSGNGDITVSGGTVSGSTAGIHNYGGNVAVSGGTVSGNTGIYNYNGGSVTVSAGSVSGSTGIYNSGSTATATVSGGSVTGSSAYGIDNRNGGTFKLSGAPDISGTTSDVYLWGTVITIDEGGLTYTEGRAISVKMSTPGTGTFTTGWTAQMGESAENYGSYFTAWSNSYTVQKDENGELELAVSAYIVSVSANPAEGGTVTGAGTYVADASVTVTATPATGYNFVNWTEGSTVVSTDASYTFTAEANRTLVANFEAKTQYTITYTDGEANGAAFTTQTYNVYEGDATPTFSGNPAWTGHTFTGWNPNVADTVTGNQIYVAQWTEKAEVSINDDTQTYTWDNDAPKSFVINGTPNTGFAVQYKVNGEWTDTAPSAVGTYDVKITREEDATYKAYEKEIIGGLVIKAATPTATAPTAKNNLVYSGDPQGLINEGSSEHGYWEYSLDSTTYSMDIPKGTDATTYTVYCRFVPNTGYGNIFPVQLSVTIAPLAVDEPTVSGSYTYTSSEQTVALDGFNSSYMTITGGNKGTYADDYEVSITLDSNHTWKSGSDGKVQWSIEPATPNVTWPVGTAYVNDTSVTLTGGSAAGVGTETSVEGSFTLEAVDLTSAGTKTVKITFAPNSTNYKNVEKTDYSVTVSKRTVESVAEQTAVENAVYGTEQDALGLPASVEITVSGNKMFTVPVTWSGYDKFNLNAQTLTGTLDLSAIAGEVENTNSVTASIVVDLQEKDAATFNYENKTETYNGSLISHEISGELEGVASITYSYIGTDGTEYAASATAPTNAGTYEVTATFTMEAGYASVAPKTATLTIEAKEIGLDWSELTYVELVYSGTAKTLTAMATNLVDGDSCIVTVELVGDNINVGGFSYKATALSNENYKLPIEVSSPEYTIMPKTLTITAEDKEAYVYSRQPELTYTVDGLIGNGTLTTIPTLTTDANMNRVGTYIITFESLASAGDNYSITYVNGTLTVKNYPYIPQPTYDVEIADNITGGEVSASKKLAYSGDTITITVAPDAGYELTKLTVTDSRGNAVAVTKISDSKYTFKMPGFDVEIDAKFAKIDTTCPGDSTCPMYPYTDLDTGLWYHDGIHYCIEHGLMVGTGANIFEPNIATSRAMIVTILWRLEGSPVVNYAMDFEDVAAGQWYTEAIRWAASEKIVEGYGNGKFGANDAITREQMVTIMWRYAKYKGYDVSVGENTNILSYDDAFDVADWAIPAMQWACGEGLVQGIADGSKMNLAPQGNATRAQAAAILQRYCENVANKD